MTDPIREENRRIKRLRFIVDLTQAILMQSELSMQEALTLIENTKRVALSLFPDKEDVYDLIYTPRFRRIIAERFKVSFTESGRN
ncbi:MAG: hypothetical protein D6710_01270 [Nitrospirae bacterium]|nr:MAG: hypothetical protein D6710_01270 [Nitrospirota bacterium]